MSTKQLLLVCIVFLANIQSNLLGGTLSFSSKRIEHNTLEIVVHAKLNPQEWLYKELLNFSVDNPNIQLSSWQSSQAAQAVYDPAFKTTKKVFEGNVDFTLQAIAQKELAPNEAHLHITFYRNKNHTPEELTFPLSFDNAQKNVADDAQQEKNILESSNNAHKTVQKSIKPSENLHENFSFSSYLSALVKQTESTTIRFLLVFLLGILLSLTPCIYPMVPITAGILQSQGGKSLFYNFLLSCSYTFGMATTFALFGLLASCTGPICGQLLMEPLFIAGLVAILTYLALSMFGFYEIYIPTFFKPSAKSLKAGSLISTFIFGAASGTIASPCVSPGLALLLSIVATLGSKFLGFLLLFAFGVGLSMPLLIIGTFSSSINLLPRAGSWMIEIKKIFGFMMLGMCLYYLSYIVSPSIMMWVTALFIAFTGFYYLYHAQKKQSSFWKNSSRLLGSALIIGAFVVCFYAVREEYAPHEIVNQNWHTDYHVAREEALTRNKKLFIDFWATFCPVCLAINKNVLTKPAILDALKHFVMLKVDGSHASHEPYASLKEKYSITGFPTFLIVDPATETVIMQLGGELYEMPEQAFITVLKQHYSL